MFEKTASFLFSKPRVTIFLTCIRGLILKRDVIADFSEHDRLVICLALFDRDGLHGFSGPKNKEIQSSRQTA